MSDATSYDKRLGAIETYFNRTAVEAWARLTSDAPVGRKGPRPPNGQPHQPRLFPFGFP